MTSLEFTIEGPPQSKERPRFGQGRAYTPTATRAYERKVRTVAEALRPVGWPLAARYSLTMHAYYGDRRRRDIDNLKCVGDACNGVLWADDSQIDELRVTRGYDKERPRVEVCVEVL